MRNSEKWQIASDAMKSGALTTGSALSLGLASVKTTVFFGLITTGSVVSLPLLGAIALGGTVLGGTATLASIKWRHRLVKKEFDKLAKE